MWSWWAWQMRQISAFTAAQQIEAKRKQSQEKQDNQRPSAVHRCLLAIAAL
jgi:hypothetical protein